MPTSGVWRQASTSRAAGVWLQAVIAPRMCGNTAKTMCCRWCVQDASCVSTAHVSKRVPFTPVCCHIQKSVSTHAHVDLKGRVSTKGLCLQDEPRCVELQILGSRRELFRERHGAIGRALCVVEKTLFLLTAHLRRPGRAQRGCISPPTSRTGRPSTWASSETTATRTSR